MQLEDNYKVYTNLKNNSILSFIFVLMYILAIADRPPKKSIIETLKENQIDLIVTLGDLDMFDLKELTYVTDIPKIGIYGNHCSGNYFEELGIRNMHLDTWEFGGLTFGGFEGCVRYKEDPYAKMYHQFEADTLLQDFPHVDVMLCHAPPFGINDDPNDPVHEGFHALRKYVEEKKPAHLMHGHTYPREDTLVTRFLDTEIVYVYGDKVLQINT